MITAGSRVAIYVITKGFGSSQLDYEKVWEGEVPHETDYAGRDEAGGELGRELLWIIARQDPLPTIGLQIVEVE